MNQQSDPRNHIFENLKEKILNFPEQPDIPESLWQDFLKLRRKLEIFEQVGYRALPSLKPLLKFLPEPHHSANILAPFCDYSFLPFVLAYSGYRFFATNENCETIFSIRNSMKILDIPQHGHFLCATAATLPFRTYQFDYIVCTYLIQKFPEPWDVLKELQRILSKQGTLIIRDFNRKGMKLLQEIRRNEGYPSDIRSVSVFEVAEFFDRQELDVTCQRDELHSTLVITYPEDFSRGD